MMLTATTVGEFADKYGDHVVLASATGTGGVLAGVWHVLPLELVTLITVAVFLCLRISFERWLHKHHARRLRKLLKARHSPPRKRRAGPA